MWRGHCWIKGKDGPRMIEQRFTEVQLNEHCHGTRTFGLCPIAPGQSTTRVACLDLDSHKGETPFEKMVEIANTIAVSLEEQGYEPHLFTSSGGAGIHIYLTWAEDQDAYSVRERLKEVIDACGFKSGTKGVAHHQIEIFPKQDEVPADGKGSMFILPWSGKSAPLGNFNGWRDSPNVPVREREERSVPSAEIGDDSAAALVKSALDAIPNGRDGPDTELSYDEWFRIVCAVSAATDHSEVGISLLLPFNARHSRDDPEFFINRVWPHLRDDRDGPAITARSLFAKASDYGWQDPTLADDFSVIEDAPATEKPGAPAAASRFKFVNEDDFAGAGPLNWIVEGVLPDADLAMVFGESGSGKSFWTLDLIKAIAAGTAWQGRDTMKGACAYVAAEGAAGFRNRLKAYRIEHPEDAGRIHVLGDTPNFLDPKHVRQLIIQLQAIRPVKIVVIDTVAQVLAGGDENSGVDMGKLIMHCQMVRKHAGCMPILIHHSGKDSSKGARGWSGMRGAIDTEIEIVRSNHDRVATVTKQKDGADAIEFGFKLRVVGIGEDAKGRPLTSCVVDHGAALPGVGARKQSRVGANERKAVELWEILSDAGGDVLTSAWLAEVKEAMKANHITTREVNKATDNATQGALDKGLLVVDGIYVRKAN
jgi:hypothetical protein